MKREIKFRAKQVDLNDWIHGYLREVFGETKRTFVIAPANKFESDGYTDVEEDYVQPDTIGQFTGLTDKNGKEIYEGDIIQLQCKENKYNCLVGWNSELGAWCISIGNKHVGVKPLGEWLCEYKFEVIGNIYDNKDLLEE